MHTYHREVPRNSETVVNVRYTSIELKIIILEIIGCFKTGRLFIAEYRWEINLLEFSHEARIA